MNQSISVIIPAYNAEKYIAEAIESVLNQTVTVKEIIVVDDQSSDNTRTVIKSFPSVRLIQQSHLGCAEARNRGIKESSGDWLAFLDADDLWVCDKLEKQLSIAEQNNYQAVFGAIKVFISPDLTSHEKQKLCCPQDPQIGFHIATMLIKRDTILKVGCFESRYLADFISWGHRLKELNIPSTILPDIVLHRRLHLSNTSRMKKQQLIRDYLTIAHQVLRNNKMQDDSRNLS